MRGPRLAALALALLAAACGASRGPGDRPDVLFLVMDTTRADRCSLLGYEKRTTPALARLAAESTVYEDAWAPSSWTAPSHGSMFTGLRPERHGLLANVRNFLADESVTLAETLRDAGYATACLTNNPMISPAMGLTQGFDLVETYDDQAVPPTPSAQWTTDRALELAKRNRQGGRSSFVFVNDWEPHLPYDPPEEIARRFLPPDAPPERLAVLRQFIPLQKDLMEMCWRRIPPGDWPLLSALYDGEIATLDGEVGRLVAGMRAAGLLEDTVLVIAGDHGENLGDHGLCGHVFSLHRSLLHVPLLVRYPGAFAPGKRVREVVRLEDLFPTLLELCGEEVPEGLDGQSLVGEPAGRIARAVLGGAIAPKQRAEFPEFADSGIWEPRRSVYDGRYHLIRTGRFREELFDVVADPREERNLAAFEGDVRERLAGMLPVLP